MVDSRDSLARHNDQILKFFLTEDTSEDLYCLGTRGWNWEENGPFKTPAGTYETALLEFFRHDPASNVQHSLNIIVVVGGIGTGKSTALARTLDQFQSMPRECSFAKKGECVGTPVTVNLDLRGIYQPEAERQQKRAPVRDQASLFWNAVTTRIHRITPDIFDFNTELAFWRHCARQSDIEDRSPTIHKWLIANERQIKAVHEDAPFAGWTINHLSQFLERARTDLIQNASLEDLAWYRVYQLGFALDRSPSPSPCRCRYIVLDNVDQLEPDVQRISVEFVEKFSAGIKGRAIISIRPLTWHRAFDAHVLVRAENHCSPSFRDVLLKRLSKLKAAETLPATAIALLRRIIDELTDDPDHLWTGLFEATAGLSVRFALRNFTNMTQSPLVPTPGEAREGPNIGMKASEFARAYFFGDGDAMISRAFDNLYRVGRDMRHSYRLVKVRILDFIIRIDGGATQLNRLVQTLRPFGYDPSLLHNALKELLRRTRPLLWSHEGHDPTQMTLSAQLAVTPIGVGYYKSLFGQLYYDEVCIARDSRDVVTADRVIVFHKELRDQDEREIRHFLKTQTTHRYLSIYPREALSISVVHARNLRIGFTRRRAQLPMGFDTQHNDDFIQRQVATLLDLDELGV